MKRCEIEVLPTTAPAAVGVTIWCSTCYENVAWKESFTEAEIVGTARGHREVMRQTRAMALSRAHRR